MLLLYMNQLRDLFIPRFCLIFREKRKEKKERRVDVLQATVKVSHSVTGDFCNTAKFFQHILSAPMKCLPLR